jgi:hypothetical protein
VHRRPASIRIGIVQPRRQVIGNPRAEEMAHSVRIGASKLFLVLDDCHLVAGKNVGLVCT